MVNGFKGQFTRIKDLSDKRRLPRLGKIRLGVKAISKKSGKEYPVETSYFVCPPEVVKVYGEQPTELDVMFPINDQDIIFPQRLVWFGSSRGVKCMGDGEKAMRIEEPDGKRYTEMQERDCPCDLFDHGCSRRANLMIMIPKVNVGGIYQIDLGSYHSIIDINSGLDYVQALVGRFAMVPLKLRRTPKETHPDGKAKQTHYTLQVFVDADISLLNSLRESTTRILTGPKYALPAPEMVNPAMDDGATVIEAEEADVPTPEEVQATLEEKGMTGPEPEGPKDNDALVIKNVIKELGKMTTGKDVNKWFSEFKKARLSERVLNESVKLVNERIEQLRKAA